MVQNSTFGTPRLPLGLVGNLMPFFILPNVKTDPAQAHDERFLML